MHTYYNITKLAERHPDELEKVLADPQKFFFYVTELAPRNMRCEQSAEGWLQKQRFPEAISQIVVRHDPMADGLRWKSLQDIYAATGRLRDSYEAFPVHLDVLDALRKMVGETITTHYAQDFADSGTLKYLEQTPAIIGAEHLVDEFGLAGVDGNEWSDEVLEAAENLPEMEDYDPVELFLNEMVVKYTQPPKPKNAGTGEQPSGTSL